MKIAIVGAGISGLTSAFYLRDHEIEVFEAGSYVGGHTNTICFNLGGQDFAVDTGFIVFNDRTYPNFVRLLSELNVASQPTSMSFSVRCDRTGLEYRGADLKGLFAQKRNLLRPKFLGMLGDIIRFNRHATECQHELDDHLTAGDFLRQHRYGHAFVQDYFLPMAAAIWSCPPTAISDFPIRFILQFYKHHGLLGLRDRPQWHVIKGGSHTYVKHLLEQLDHPIHLNSPVKSVNRVADHVEVVTANSSCRYNHVIFACHADQALRILGATATSTERSVLSHFPYQSNVAVLHTDTSLLPRAAQAWASWNYLKPKDSDVFPVTYYMNALQGLRSSTKFCVTLNGERYVNPESVIKTIQYAHPVYTAGRNGAAQRHSELIGPNRTSYCGAYWGNGFHEDGVTSALRVVNHLQSESRLCAVDGAVLL